jgi:hypothetical protein
MAASGSLQWCPTHLILDVLLFNLMHICCFRYLQNSLQPLTTFQKLRNMTHHALFQFFLRRYREEKRARKQAENERDKAIKDLQVQ